MLFVLVLNPDSKEYQIGTKPVWPNFLIKEVKFINTIGHDSNILSNTLQTKFLD